MVLLSLVFSFVDAAVLLVFLCGILLSLCVATILVVVCYYPHYPQSHLKLWIFFLQAYLNLLFLHSSNPARKTTQTVHPRQIFR